MHVRQMFCTDAAAWLMQLCRGLAATTAAVIVAYFFIDLPVVYFFREAERHRLLHPILKWLTRPPELFAALSPIVLIAALLRRWFGPWTRPEKIAVAASLATLIAALVTLLLKVAIGRSGPDLVFAEDGSFLDGPIYGFFPFQVSRDYWALPSGHTACTFSFMSVVAATIPPGRFFWWTIAAIVPVSLVALSWHFVGDVLAGAYVGWAIAETVVRWTGSGQPIRLVPSSA